LSSSDLFDAAAEDGRDLFSRKKAAQRIWARDTLVVLYGSATHAAAVDLESKFTEAALGHTQLADYRNFAHGRHHWLAKHGGTSAILAFSDESDRVLASKTLSLVPKGIPVARLDFSGEFLQVMMASLLTTLHIVGWAGEARQIDPGRPGVPEFGRRLFRLAVRRSSPRSSDGGTSPTDAAAIERKTGLPIRCLRDRGDLLFWQQALAAYKGHLADARFGAAVFDYDGTLVDARERFASPRQDVARELTRFLRGGLLVGIATGRGVSVRRDLRSCIPKTLWSKLIVGYYNGAEVASLDEDTVPDGTKTVSGELAGLNDALSAHPELRSVATISPRRWQITVEPKALAPENRLWDIVNQIVQLHGPQGISVVRSSHSIDVLAPGISKASVLRRVSEACSRKSRQAVLKIGDRGRWPGNDFVLLREPYSISVEEVSVDPATCWNLAPPGHRGVQVALSYCRSLQRAPNSDGWRFVMSRLVTP
jgi:hydroxymethylpyrimidine pyrophosphatase-like HAD family hydrolase